MIQTSTFRGFLAAKPSFVRPNKGESGWAIPTNDKCTTQLSLRLYIWCTGTFKQVSHKPSVKDHESKCS